MADDNETTTFADAQIPPGGPAPEKTPTNEPNTIKQDLQEMLGDNQNLDMLLDVDLRLTVEFGRTRMKFRDVLDLATGSIVELPKQTSEPVDILVNGALLATGEVVVMDDHFGVRITKLLNRIERLRRSS
jgi:flagellar motor switch protein FliN/FliY